MCSGGQHYTQPLKLNFSFTFLSNPLTQSQHVVLIWSFGYALSSLASMWFIMVHTWNIFFGVKQAGQINVPHAAHSHCTAPLWYYETSTEAANSFADYDLCVWFSCVAPRGGTGALIPTFLNKNYSIKGEWSWITPTWLQGLLAVWQSCRLSALCLVQVWKDITWSVRITDHADRKRYSKSKPCSRCSRLQCTKKKTPNPKCLCEYTTVAILFSIYKRFESSSFRLHTFKLLSCGTCFPFHFLFFSF